MNVPMFPLIQSPENWDELTLLAGTIFLEAEGEPDEGKVAVSWVIQNRATGWKQPMGQVMLAKEQFSCWNPDSRRHAETRLAASNEDIRERCWRAAAGAYWRLLTNPVPKALFYLNVDLVKRARSDGHLPSWAADPKDLTQVDQTKVVAIIGGHTFLASESSSQFVKGGT